MKTSDCSKFSKSCSTHVRKKLLPAHQNSTRNEEKAKGIFRDPPLIRKYTELNTSHTDHFCGVFFYIFLYIQNKEFYLPPLNT